MSTNASTVSDAAFDAMKATAQKLGKRDGANAWDGQYMPGGGRDTAPDAKGRAARLLAMIDDGDPEACDGLVSSSPLSGEWADSITASDVADAVGYPYEDEPEDERDDAVDELAQAYEWGWTDGQFEAACAFLRNVAEGK